MFVDQVRIRVEGGVGGSGAEAFRRESGVPRGGPSGGDGGRGGSVILVADGQLSTLMDFRYNASYRAPRGQHGQGSDKTGKSGEDLVLRVPPGTEVRDLETGELLGELLTDGNELVIARGGRGGRGNARFKTATHQAPRRWEPGEEGEERTVELTLKLIADIGLVGEPNAGKSTLLASISEARPRVADYPFTTLTPNLGVVELSDYRQFVVADIPGIIEGAHEGKGLGHQFLRHIERTRSLALLVPLDDPDPQSAYDRLRVELGEYSVELAQRPHSLVFSKSDLLPPDAALPEVATEGAAGVFRISSVTRQGIPELLEGLWTSVRAARDEERKAAPPAPDEGDAEPPKNESEMEEEAWWSEAEGEG